MSNRTIIRLAITLTSLVLVYIVLNLVYGTGYTEYSLRFQVGMAIIEALHVWLHGAGLLFLGATLAAIITAIFRP